MIIVALIEVKERVVTAAKEVLVVTMKVEVVIVMIATMKRKVTTVVGEGGNDGDEERTHGCGRVKSGDGKTDDKGDSNDKRGGDDNDNRVGRGRDGTRKIELFCK